MKVREGVDKWCSFGRTMWKSAARILNHKSLLSRIPFVEIQQYALFCRIGTLQKSLKLS